MIKKPLVDALAVKFMHAWKDPNLLENNTCDDDNNDNDKKQQQIKTTTKQKHCCSNVTLFQLTGS